ncbi:DUF4376 domain-containing protein [Mesorhizobium sp. ANAO-SY3R2]|uniref:DUF4376 domain-containing protein n=1 Tax=Mesorhizobium sp. ANAO-SY3R2 TaxID=3166644 RepID=UPI003671A367
MMAETGFFHPDRGYWQAIDGSPNELLPNYPEGTSVVPLRPSSLHVLQDGEWVLQAVPLTERKAARLTSLAEKRWQVETGGIVVGGTRIATDIASQNRIGNAYAGAQRFPDRPIDFNGVDGWVTLDPASMIAIGDAVYLHVQACFSRHKALALQINGAADQAALDAIDIEADWPGS